MSDVHLHILRAAARRHARLLLAHRARPEETLAASVARRAELERLASRARARLTAATARRPLAGGVDR
jgi:hypothetical protein